MVDLVSHGHDAGVAALKLARRLAKVINIETKFFDYSSSSNPSNSGAVEWITNVTQGNNVSNRIGDSIRAQSLQVTFAVSIHTSEPKNTVVRFLLVKDWENAGATPAVTDIITANGSSVNMLSPVNWFNRTRFTIVDDVLMDLDVGGENALVFRKTYKVHNHLRYRGTAGTAADIAEGNYFILFISDEATNTPQIRFWSRLLYTDD